MKIYKICRTCQETKSVDFFHKLNTKLGTYQVNCKACVSVGNLEYYRSQHGHLVKLYNGQKTSSKRRNHPVPTYSRKEFM